VARAPPSLRQLAWLFTLLAAFRLLEAVPFLLFAVTRWADPILAGLADGVVVLVGADVILAVFLSVIAAGLFLGSRGMYHFVLASMRGPDFLLLAVSLFAFVFLNLFVIAAAIVNILLVITVLAVTYSPQTRREVDAMDYERAGVDAVSAVVARRGFREPVRAAEEDALEVEYVDPRGWLCPECDGYNHDSVAVCSSCGHARPAPK